VSRHWKPQRNGWLDPQAYNTLSPAEKRALHFRRAAERQLRGGRTNPARRRSESSTVTPANWLLATLFVGTICVTEFGLPVPASWRPHSAPVSASFDYCKWGGGTNCVVDGDTFYLNGEKVRIAGIDAPETHDYRCESELALGNQATEKLHALLNSGAVTMTSIDRNRDVYGRLLRNVAVNGEDVGEAMIASGVAREYGSGRQTWC
jgi:micrococcal nuclease